jgi:hypothetical protein
MELAKVDRPDVRNEADRNEAVRDEAIHKEAREAAKPAEGDRAAGIAGKDAATDETTAIRAKDFPPAPSAPSEDVPDIAGAVEEVPLATKQPALEHKVGAARSVDAGRGDRSAMPERAPGAAKGGAGVADVVQTARSPAPAQQQAVVDAPASETALAGDLVAQRPSTLWVVTAAATPEVRRELYKTFNTQAIDLDDELADERSKSEALEKSTEALDIEGTPEQAAAVVALLQDRGALLSSVELDAPKGREIRFGSPPTAAAPAEASEEMAKSADKRPDDTRRAGDARRRTTEDRKADKDTRQSKSAATAPEPDATQRPLPAPTAPIVDSEKPQVERADAQSGRAQTRRGTPSGGVAQPVPKKSESADGQSRQELGPAASAQTQAQQSRGTVRRLQVQKSPQLEALVQSPDDAPRQDSVRGQRESAEKTKADSLEKRQTTARDPANEPQAPPHRVRIVLLLRDP